MLVGIIKHAWRPIVEITILTIAIYYAFIFVRGTRGWPVVIGFLVMLALTFVSTYLQLEVLSWLLRTFFAFSVKLPSSLTIIIRGTFWRFF